MRLLIAKSLDRLDKLSMTGAVLDRNELSPLVLTLPPIQDAYESLIQQSLSLLAKGKVDEGLELLHTECAELQTIQERIGYFVGQVAPLDQPFIRLVLEYLHTRTRLLDQIKMFPGFGIKLLEKASVDESLEDIIYMMELAMTGKEGLYQALMSYFEELKP